MSNDGLLVFGYAFVIVVYGGYWIALKARLAEAGMVGRRREDSEASPDRWAVVRC